MNASTPRHGNGLLVLIALAVVGGGAYWLGRTSNSPTSAPVEVPKPEEQPLSKGTVKLEGETLKLANLELGVVREVALPTRLMVTGEVEPNLAELVKVTPHTEGKVIRILANVGDTVHAGQTLAIVQSEKLHIAQIEHRHALKKVELARSTLERRKKLAALGEYGRPNVEEARTRSVAAQGEVQKEQSEVSTSQSMVAEAESQARAFQAAQTQARARLDVAQSRFNRAESLYKEQLVSRQDVEQAQAEVRQAQADVDVARANLAQGAAKIDSANSRLNAAKAALESAVKRGQVAQQALARAEAVYKGNYLTSKEVAEAETAYQQAQIEADGALDDIELLGGKPGDLHSIPVLAPISGRISERLVTLGETVAADKSLLVILNTQAVWVQLNVYPKDVAGLRIGQEVKVTSETIPGRIFRGTLSHISDTADETTRTVKVRCVIQNDSGTLKPGVFVTGEIVSRAENPGLAVPADSVQFVDSKPVVYVPGDKEGEFRETSVEIGVKHEGMIEIRSGLKPGDRVVTKNAFLVKSQAMKSELGEE